MPEESTNVLAPRNFDEGAETLGVAPDDNGAARGEAVATLRLLWDRKRFLFRLTLAGLVLSAITAFLIPKRYQSTARLMPPDQMDSGSEVLAAVAGNKVGSSLGSAASSLLGLGNTSELFVGILQSRTIANDVSERFDLKKIYGVRLEEDAEMDLQANTDISEDRKSGIISIAVTDKSPERAAAMTQEYVDALNGLVTQVNTSAAHREREFLEGRLTQVKLDLESAEKDFGKFASENTAIDIQEQGKAM
ncbi:MAG TPA: Wzz/FepE/Etk N-terminal domain-containing protein, partial [Methylomirabilota bacterium]|nr:Wzz/FepE/Etk N-terminal domain-containing protein [Methylomirabilota bacterium]